MTQPLVRGTRPFAVSSDTGVFVGYASLFNRPDQAGDLVMGGAFAESLARKGAGGIRMLFQHDPAEPVGTWVELAEDRRGLRVRGRLARGVQRASELNALLEQRALDGLSIGFKAVEATRDRFTGVRRIHRIDLWEISLVTFPMLAEARVTTLIGKAGRSLQWSSARKPGPTRRTIADGHCGTELGPGFRPNDD